MLSFLKCAVCCVASVIRPGAAARALLFLLGMIGTFGLASVAQAQAPVLPDVGVPIDTYVETIGTDTGVIVLAVLGVFAAFLVIRFGWQWLRRAK